MPDNEKCRVAGHSIPCKVQSRCKVLNPNGDTPVTYKPTGRAEQIDPVRT